MLDLGGVLTQDQNADKADEMMGLLGAGEKASFLSAYWKHRLDYDRGVADHAVYWRRIAADLGLSFPERALSDIVRADLQSWFTMRGRMLDFLGGVQGRVKSLVLLSNINPDGARFVRSQENRGWASYFDELILSCEHRLLKPEPEIYELALDAAGALPGETLFVDDNPDNVEGARRAGLSSFRFVDEEDFEARLKREYEFTR